MWMEGLPSGGRSRGHDRKAEVGCTAPQSGDRALSLDLYRRERPGDTPPVPAVIVVHGGGWESGGPDELPELNAYLAARGYLVAVPEYRLAPEHPFPAGLEDVRAAIAFVRGRARQWNVEGDGVVLIGRSAGAQLALLAAYTADVNAVRGAVSIYGLADLQFAHDHPGNPRVYDGIGVLERYLGGPPSSVPGAYREASPYGLVGPSTPPTLLIHGRKDEIVWVEQSRRLDARLAEASRPRLLLELPWATHGCDFTLAGPCGQLTTYAVERFIAAVTAH
jgi:acetyl esterase/lipase